MRCYGEHVGDRLGTTKIQQTLPPFPPTPRRKKHLGVLGARMLQLLIGLAEIRFAQLMARTWIVGDTLKP